LQSIRGTTSHFNIKTATDIMIFNFMGILILIFTVTCILICIAFFRQQHFNISSPYLWAIRLGLLFFIFSSLEGGMMIGMMKHTVGAADGTPGIPLLNWSKEYGDLRIAHFLGIHSLQVLPLIGFYLAKSKKQVILASVVFFICVMVVFVQALRGIPLFL